MSDIRAVEPADWEMLRRVRLAALEDAPYAFGSTHDREAAFDEAEWRSRCTSSRWFIAYEADIPIGIAAAYPVVGTTPELVGMWVSASARGFGVAESLVDAVREWAIAAGVSRLLCGVTEDNARAKRFYKRFGFEPTGNRKPLASNPALHIDELGIDLRRCLPPEVTNFPTANRDGGTCSDGGIEQ